ncbi:MAG: hypothetical protein ACREHD_02170, partial [Pirellulales bacterium]
MLDADEEMLAELACRLKPKAEATLPECIHALHCFGREVAIPTQPSGTSRPIVEIILDSRASREHFGGAQGLSETRYGARFPRYVGPLLGTNQSASE